MANYTFLVTNPLLASYYGSSKETTWLFRNVICLSFGDPSSWVYHAIYAPTIDGEK